MLSYAVVGQSNESYPGMGSSGASPEGPRPMLSAAELQRVLDCLRSGSLIYFRAPDGGLQLIALSGPGELVVGRQATCAVALPWDPSVSRAHAVLHALGSEWAIEDDGLSRNGTFVNGERVTRARRLANGDAIRVGSTVLTFRSPRLGYEGQTQTLHIGASEVRLTAAQRRVLEALCRPMLDAVPDALPAGNRQIAEELFLSVETVKSHMRSLSALFGVDHLPQSQRRYVMAQSAIRLGLVPGARQ
ncbi:MAG TPA: FHA domain-containing protein [Solirubrobacteraceae bacterium]|nr:FHA domain-containing protein [Solirubrobacteraceae bacterium]